MRKTNFNSTDALLALKEGREEGLQTFFDQYFTPLCFFATSILHDEPLAEEIASEAFTRLWEHREALSPEANIKSWLYTTVRNSSIDHLRKVKRLRINEQGLQTADTIEQSVLERMVATETITHIVKTIEQLPPQARKIFQLFYLQHKSYREIAAELRLSPQTVRNQKQRAAKLLKKMVGPMMAFLVSFF